MSKYKEVMLAKGIMQKEVLESVRRADRRVDKPLMSKIVNDICLPTPQTIVEICRVLKCSVLDLYDEREITLSSAKKTQNKEMEENKNTAKTKNRRKKSPFYNLTVEIERTLAERVFSKESLRRLGYLSKTDFVRKMVEQAVKRLDEMDAQYRK